MAVEQKTALPAKGVAAIVLAAGMSSRMGTLKPLLPFGDKPMLARVLESLSAVAEISPVFVVLGYAREEIAPVVSVSRAIPILNPDYAAGEMLSSVQAGVRALPADCAAFFLVLGDQPGVRPETLQMLLAAWRETNAPILVPTHDGQRGHPLFFDSRCAPEILALPAGATLKDLTSRYTAQRQEVPVPDPAILADVDTPEDYARALRNG